MDVSNLGLLFLGLGGLSAVIAILLFLRTRRFLSDAVSVQGMVTGMSERSGSEGGTVYSPVVQFTTVEGQSLTFTDSVGQNPPKYATGDTVKVMYSPGDPDSARIPSWFRLWFLPSFAALFAVIFLAVGGFVYAGADEITLPGGITVPDIGEGVEPGQIPTGLRPSVPPSGEPVLIISQGSGAPSPVPVTCEAIRELKGGRDREVRLRFDGGELTFRASPYTGPGPYIPGSNLEVGGTVFQGEASPLSGAAVFDDSGRAGAVNLVAGSRIASGSWDCTDIKL